MAPSLAALVGSLPQTMLARAVPPQGKPQAPKPEVIEVSDVSVGVLVAETAHLPRTATAPEAEKVLGAYLSTGSERVAVRARQQAIRSLSLCLQYSTCSEGETVVSGLDSRLLKELSRRVAAVQKVRLGCVGEEGGRAMEKKPRGARGEEAEAVQLGGTEAAASNIEGSNAVGPACDAFGVVDMHTNFAGIVADTEASWEPYAADSMAGIEGAAS